MYIFYQIILLTVGSICEFMISGYMSSKELPFIVKEQKNQLTTVEFISIDLILTVDAKHFYKQIV